MIRILIILFLMVSPVCSGGLPESWYRDQAALVLEGKAELPMTDGTRADIVTATHAWEVDFGPKWAEAIGQSLLYAELTGKQPGIILVLEKPGDFSKFVPRLQRALSGQSRSVALWVVTRETLLAFAQR